MGEKNKTKTNEFKTVSNTAKDNNTITIELSGQPENPSHPKKTENPGHPEKNEKIEKNEKLDKTMKRNSDFAMRLKSYRKAKEMSQKDFAAFLGISFRTYQNYEGGFRYPKSMEIINKIATALGVNAEDLLGSSGGYIVEAGEKGGARDQRRMAQMVTQLSAMFAGGEIDQESKDAAMAALNEVYWKHKTENRERYTTKKNKEKS